MCFYEVNITIRVIQKYLNPKFLVPDFLGFIKPVVIPRTKYFFTVCKSSKLFLFLK